MVQKLNGALIDNQKAIFAQIGEVVRVIDVTARKFGAKGDGTTDDSAAIQAAIDAAEAAGAGIVHFPPGRVYRVTSDLTVSGKGIVLDGGAGHDENPATDQHAMIRADAGVTDLLTISGNQCQVRNLQLDGANIAETALSITGWYNTLFNMAAKRGTNYALFSQSANRMNVLLCHFHGTDGAVAAARFGGSDMIITSVHAMSRGADVAVIHAGSGCLVTNCHYTGTATATGVMHVRGSQNIFSNIYYDTANAGPLITIGADFTLTGNRILNSYLFNINLQDDTYPAILIDGSEATVKHTKIEGNHFEAGGNSERFSYALEISGSNFTTHFANNTVRWATALWNTRPQVSKGNSLTTEAAGNNARFSENAGRATFSGNGSQTQFNILGFAIARTAGVVEPRALLVTAGSEDAAGDFWAEFNTSVGRIEVHYATAPPSGSDNVVLNWYIEV